MHLYLTYMLRKEILSKMKKNCQKTELHVLIENLLLIHNTEDGNYSVICYIYVMWIGQTD